VLAEKAGISEVSVCYYELGKELPHFEDIDERMLEMMTARHALSPAGARA